jgi:serine/threonine protein kinase
MPPSEPEDLGETRAEELYDSYVEAALAGEAVEPEQFLAERGFDGGPVVAELVDRLRSIRALAGSGLQARRRASGDLPFERVGEFRLVEKIGSGAMGVVYLAEQGSLARLVALKVIREELAGTLGAEQRFEREARALARIQHPGIVRLLGFGREEGVRYLAMEWVPGQSLSEVMAEQRSLEPVQVAQWGLELARGLARVHASGLLHRDVKPSNVRIHEDGHAVLVDFGLSRSVDLASVSSQGGFAGSLGYASPEQVRASGELDVTTDVYSLAASLYHALAGRPPIEAEGIEALLQRILREDPANLRQVRPEVPADLATVIHHALAKDPRRRYPSALDFAADLERVLALKPIRAKAPGPWHQFQLWTRRNPAAAGGTLVALFCLLAVVALLIMQSRWREEQRLADARLALAEARAEVASYRSGRERMAQRTAELRDLSIDLEYSYLDEASRSRHAELLDEVESSRHLRAGAGFRVGDLLTLAQRLDPALADEASDVRAEFLVEQWRDALDSGDASQMRLFEQELNRLDPTGELRLELLPKQRVPFHYAGEPCDVYLFRMVELELRPSAGVPRDVAQPWGREGPLPANADGTPAWLAPGQGAEAPGLELSTWCLRPADHQAATADGRWTTRDFIVELDGQRARGGPLVAADFGPLERGDRIVAVDGQAVRDAHDVLLYARDKPESRVSVLRGERREEFPVPDLAEADLASLEAWAERFGGAALRYRDGRLERVELPAGRAWRTSTAPTFYRSAYRLDPADGPLQLERGSYVLVALREGCAPQRVGIFVNGLNDTQPAPLDPRPLGFAPEGFVHTGSAGMNGYSDVWAHEYEVLSADWREFLDDPEIRRQQELNWASGGRAFLPRAGGRFERGTLWRRAADDSWEIHDWSWDWPVIGISPNDALAYAAWCDARVDRGTITIGTYGDRMVSGFVHRDRRYAWGRRYCPQSGNTCFSRPIAGLEPVGNNPLDQNPLGLFDVVGNASELIDAWFDEANGYRLAVGGNWGEPRADRNRADAFLGFRPDQSGGVCGVRLYWKPDAEAGG